MNTRCSGIRGILIEYTKYDCQICATQQANKGEDFPKIELNGQSLVIVGKFCYLGDTIKVGGGAHGGVKTRVRGRWSKFRHLLPLLASRSLPLGAKCRLNSPCVHSVILYENETYPFKKM